MTFRIKCGIFWRCIGLIALLIALLVAGAWEHALPPSFAVTRQQPMNTPSQQLETLVHKAREAWLTGNADAWAALFVPEGEFVAPGYRWVGQEAIRKAAADFAASSEVVSIEIRRMFQQGNQAVVEWHWQDRERSTQRLNRADDAIVIDFKADRILRWREYIDAQTPAQSKP